MWDDVGWIDISGCNVAVMWMSWVFRGSRFLVSVDVKHHQYVDRFVAFRHGMQNTGVENPLRLRAVQSIPGECMDIIYAFHETKPSARAMDKAPSLVRCIRGYTRTQYVGALANQFARPPSVNKQVSVCKAYANR